jgi:hypothetical protein
MAIKVFISHHSSDSTDAQRIRDHLRSRHSIESYLDLIDPFVGRPGEELAQYQRGVMATCTNLMAVVSPSTKASQWVPWEIGVASEREMPLASYLSSVMIVPEFLRAWPRLHSMADVDRYASASRASEGTVLRKRADRMEESAALRAGSTTFYQDLRKSLNQ